ncbi:hypothetical protein HXX76_002878 [Chlamydomonas incerta]|uniref:Uncharacterized protein n=1 Tax=Chlamydomonas incerta TaxID=51695 RepID=A0A835W9A8_CHLIN|nr:hypothetical protein HXX76_002878 [Chlamydomonas incerta]|eukprot:KAG2442799.1 hypothetical protein HXX76_002878 [Chlamydomonas incerta]
MVGTKGAIRGYLFEQGGTFSVVPISSDEELSRAGAGGELQLPSCTSSSFKDVQEIWANGELQKNIYFVPVQANFRSRPTVDSVLLVDKTLHMFQMTVDSSKTVNATALSSMYKKLGVKKLKDLDLCLYYVVPADILDGFKLRADASWPPGKRQSLAARTRLFLLNGNAEARLLPQQQAGVNRQKPAATVAAARPAAMMVAPMAKRAAASSSSRVRRVGGQLLAFWR